MANTSFEQRFQEFTDEERQRSTAVLAEVESDAADRAQDRAERRFKRGRIVVGLAALTLVGGAVSAMYGHETLGDGVRSIFVDDQPPITSPIQNEKLNLENAEETGEPLITNQR
ncbi:MAG: hypothetical protein Q7R60_00090 [bacterium]|nr:hypothetical protein [bacterium]